MTTLLDAWIWYEKNRRLLQLIGRLGKKYWNHLPWPILEKDDRFRLLEGKTVEAEAESVLAEFDDLGIFVLFSVFEAVVRIYVHSNVSHEAAGLQHEALKRGAEHLLRNIADGSFYTNVLDLYKGVDHDKVEEVSQVRKYRNWVAHGRQEGKRPFAISPKDAFDRLQAFLDMIGYVPSSTRLPEPPSVAEIDPV